MSASGLLFSSSFLLGLRRNMRAQWAGLYKRLNRCPVDSLVGLFVGGKLPTHDDQEMTFANTVKLDASIFTKGYTKLRVNV